MRQKITLITLGVQDMEVSRNFYQEGLGWTPSKASQESIVFFDLGGVGLALFPIKELAKDATICKERSGFSGITLAHNAKDKEEVDRVLQQAKKAGGKIIKEAQMVFWGGYSGYFADPDDHLWEVAWNPFLEFDANDALIFP